MKFFRIDLLTLLISLFILSSCKNQDSVGLGVNPSLPLGSNLVDTSTIVINTDTIGSIVTTGLGKNPLAYFVDPIFGTTIANLATDLNLPGEAAYTPPAGTVTIDSARLVLNYADGFYGDSLTSNYTVNVYQLGLGELYHADSTYYNTKQWKTGNLLGSLTFNARTHDSIKVYNIIAGAPDTLVKVAPQIRIPINTAFINTYLFGATSQALGSNPVFASNVRGLYITINRAQSTGAGGILMFQATDSLAVYYHAVNGTTIDTGLVNLPIAHMAANVQHIFSQTIQTELNNKTTGSRNTFYLQGLAGLRAKVSFPNLLYYLRKPLLAHDSDILINRAELVITPSPGTYIPYQPLPKITMYQLDLANQPEIIQDASADPRSGGYAVFGGFYQAAQNQYHFILTAFLQDQLSGKSNGASFGTYIAPVDTTNKTGVDFLPTVQVAARTVAIGTDNTGDANSKYRIRLNIIYTKIAKH